MSKHLLIDYGYNGYVIAKCDARDLGEIKQFYKEVSGIDNNLSGELLYIIHSMENSKGSKIYDFYEIYEEYIKAVNRKYFELTQEVYRGSADEEITRLKELGKIKFVGHRNEK